MQPAHSHLPRHPFAVSDRPFFCLIYEYGSLMPKSRLAQPLYDERLDRLLSRLRPTINPHLITLN